MIDSRFTFRRRLPDRLVFRQITLVVTSLVCITFGCAAATSQDGEVASAINPQRQARPVRTDRERQLPEPMISILVGPGEKSIGDPGGVVFAVWEDGRVMRSAFAGRVTNRITQGTLSDQQLGQLRTAALSLRDHPGTTGHACCAYQSVRVNSGSARGTYTHALVPGRESGVINDFVAQVWRMEIAGAVSVSGAEHGRNPNSRLNDIYPEL